VDPKAMLEKAQESMSARTFTPSPIRKAVSRLSRRPPSGAAEAAAGTSEQTAEVVSD
jgi:hypothetical protein